MIGDAGEAASYARQRHGSAHSLGAGVHSTLPRLAAAATRPHPLQLILQLILQAILPLLLPRTAAALSPHVRVTSQRFTCRQLNLAATLHATLLIYQHPFQHVNDKRIRKREHN